MERSIELAVLAWLWLEEYEVWLRALRLRRKAYELSPSDIQETKRLRDQEIKKP